MRHLILPLLLAPGLALAEVPQGPPNAPYQPAFETQTRAPALPASRVQAEPFASGLQNPWGIALLPDGSLLVTERPGRMRRVAPDGTLGPEIAGLPPVDARDQGGLLDVAVAPDFAQSRVVFWTYAKPLGDGLTVTAAARGVLSQDATAMTEVTEIFVQSPASDTPMHYGSRIIPDPPYLWITTGEHSSAPERERAQDPATTWGKVIRLALAGGVPSSNPLVGVAGADPQVWSLGHRNMQGAALDPQGRLWTIEHGPLGGDELNRPEAGANHGWPVVSYGLNYNGSPVGSGQPRAEGFVEPVYYWDPVIAPGGMLFYDGALFPDWQGDLLIGSLNPGGLVRLTLSGDRVTGEERMLPELGRVRDVEAMPDGSLILALDARRGGLVRVTPG